MNGLWMHRIHVSLPEINTVAVKPGRRSIGFLTECNSSSLLDRFCIAPEVHVGEADPHYPLIGKIIARRRTKCLVDVSFDVSVRAKFSPWSLFA
jgi:hypothetical protein